MSSLLRSEAVAVLDHRNFGTSPSAPRLFGTRVLRGDHVGIERPIPLSVPAKPEPVRFEEEAFEEVVEAGPPPDFAAIEEAVRQQGYAAGFGEGRAAGQAAGLAAAEEATAEALRQLAAVLDGIH